MEENRSFSFSNLLIKIIIIMIFVIFTIWLLSLGNRNLTNSLDVLTDNIFSQNIEKMKEVGKEYFTTERLPEKVGEIKTITLKEMYEKKLILELTDKEGKACSAKDSYISVEKYDDEYQMKVYLECGDEADYIIVIMGCYDYCDTDICEKVEPSNKQIEYQYVKTTGGSWTDYGKWSEWSKVLVTGNNYRQVETKIEKEEYSYDKVVSETVYEKMNAKCPSGYTQSGDSCFKVLSITKESDPVCPTLSGYNYIGRNGFTCNYSTIVTDTDTVTTTKTATCPSGYTQSGDTCVKTNTTSADPVCPTLDGYNYIGRNGFTCNYSKVSNSTAEPICPTISGYNYIGRNGFTCNYSKVSSSTTEPICPTLDGYTYTGRNGFTCNYKKYTKGAYLGMDSGETVPGNDSQYIYEEVGSAEYVYDCENGCAMKWIHTWEIYQAKLETTTKTATCPSGYTQSGSTCAKSVTETKTSTATCPSGYTQSGNTCTKGVTETKTSTATCPVGYTQSGSACVKKTTTTKNPVCPTVDGYEYIGRNGFTCNYSKDVTNTDVVTTTKTATCPSGYVKSANSCYKTTVQVLEEDLIKSCPSGYTKTVDGSKCYKEVESTVTVTGTKDVTYYRYRVREYKGGTTDYKWSFSKEDKSLINAGYKLTGNTR